MRSTTNKFLLLFFLLLTLTVTASARSSIGGTDYSGGYAGLSEMVVFVLTLARNTVLLVNTIAGILSIYSATSIYIKLNAGEEGFLKSLYLLIGSILFLMTSTAIFPAIFRYSII